MWTTTVAFMVGTAAALPSQLDVIGSFGFLPRDVVHQILGVRDLPMADLGFCLLLTTACGE